MTWEKAQAEADRRIECLRLPAEPARLDGVSITLLDFQNEGLLMALASHARPLTWHRMVNQAMKRTLENRGATVKINFLTFESTIGRR